MGTLLRIEVPDQRHADTLTLHLLPHGAGTVVAEDHCEVQVELPNPNLNSRIVAALNAVDEWLLSAGLASVRVHLYGNPYTLNAPVANETDNAIA